MKKKENPTKLAIPSLEDVAEERDRLQKQAKTRKSIFNVVGILAVVSAIAILIATQWLPIVQIYGTSMVPVLEDGQIVIAYKDQTLDRGDIIAFYFNNKVLVKRVIAQGGDWVNIDEDGVVYVNNEKIDEPYLIDQSLGENDLIYPYQVPDEQYFVLGDHRSVSIDSRSNTIGCVSNDQMIGHLTIIIWPLHKISIIS